MKKSKARASIYVEDARVLAINVLPEEQYILRLASPKCAAAAQPGQFIHLRCDDGLPMRRPYSILSASPTEGWIDILFAIKGLGSRLLANKKPGDTLSNMGPIGEPFAPTPERRNVLLLGGGVGMPPILFLAETLAKDTKYSPLVMLASERPFPFDTTPNIQEMAQETTGDGTPEQATMTLSRLADLGVRGYLASQRGYDGCYKGYLHEMADQWLQNKSHDELPQIALFGCGPPPMLKACAMLAAKYGVPCQLSFEENMACAVGGCAGCAIPLRRDGQDMMKRVCVDGPVFEAREVYPDLFRHA